MNKTKHMKQKKKKKKGMSLGLGFVLSRASAAGSFLYLKTMNT